MVLFLDLVDFGDHRSLGREPRLGVMIGRVLRTSSTTSFSFESIDLEA